MARSIAMVLSAFVARSGSMKISVQLARSHYLVLSQVLARSEHVVLSDLLAIVWAGISCGCGPCELSGMGWAVLRQIRAHTKHDEGG